MILSFLQGETSVVVSLILIVLKEILAENLVGLIWCCSYPSV